MSHEAGPVRLPIRPETSVQSLPTGANLTPAGQLIEATGRFRQIGLDHRGGTITTDERDKRIDEVMQELPDKVQNYFRGKVKGTEMTELRAILEGKEINDLKPKSKKKDPGELEKSKHKGKHKWKQRHRDTSYIKSLMTKSH